MNDIKNRAQVIFHHNGIDWYELPLICLMFGSVTTVFWCIFPNALTIIIGLGMTSLALWFIFKIQKTSYKIYPDRIDFFNENTPKKVDTIKNSDIFQVRYEDEFGDSFGSTPTLWFIYAYLKENHTCSSKKGKGNKIRLYIRRKNKNQSIIQVLKFYQEQGKQVYILTKYKEINEALGLKNWN